jgi:hypothetical protein
MPVSFRWMMKPRVKAHGLSVISSICRVLGLAYTTNRISAKALISLNPINQVRHHFGLCAHSHNATSAGFQNLLNQGIKNQVGFVARVF